MTLLGSAAAVIDHPAEQSRPLVSEGLVTVGLRNELAGPFNAAFPPGSISVIAGASGSGKSLFLRMLADLDPGVGAVRLDGVERASMSAPVWRSLVPYVAAESGSWQNLAIDHFDEPRRDHARALAGRLGVLDRQFDGPVDRLSTGERQRLALVRALVLGSPVLLLDEPTGPLDPASVTRVEELLVERAEAGTIIVMVSHDPGQASRLGAFRFRMSDRNLVREA